MAEDVWFNVPSPAFTAARPPAPATDCDVVSLSDKADIVAFSVEFTSADVPNPTSAPPVCVVLVTCAPIATAPIAIAFESL